MKIASLLLMIILLLQSCKTKTETIDLVKYGFKYSLTCKQKNNTIKVAECSDNDYVKYWIFSYLVLKDLEKVKKTFFYFETKKGVVDSLIYSKNEIIEVQQDFRRNSCLLKSCTHIMSKLSNKKILFYDKILYDIMIYDSQLNEIDTAHYAFNDISIVASLYNKCLYDENNVPQKYLNQSNYLKVIPIWCEDRRAFPLYDKNDLIIR